MEFRRDIVRDVNGRRSPSTQRCHFRMVDQGCSDKARAGTLRHSEWMEGTRRDSTGSDFGNVVPRLHGEAPANAGSDPSMVAKQSIPCSANPGRRLHRCMFSDIYGCRMILSETSDFHPIHTVHARCMGNVYRLRITSDDLVRENHVFTIEKHCIHNGTLYEMKNMQPCM
ncbi:hypothetical protein KP509_1Z127800 [Ceratopteris richardii]|nr:hypothetical protein KP509_1Z127800 [Ceratopteris richardii]